MSSEKDDVKGPEEEPVVAPEVDPNEDPSLIEEDGAEASGTDAASAAGDFPAVPLEEGASAAAESVETPAEDPTQDPADGTYDPNAEIVADAAEGGDGDGGDGGDDDEDEDEDDEETDGEGGQMSLLEHLGELRVRLTRSFIAIGIGMVACYSFAEQMFNILMQPMVEVFQKQAANNPMLTPGFYEDLGRALAQVLAEKGFQHTEQLPLFMEGLQKSLSQLAQEGHFQYTYPAEAFFSYIMISVVAGLFLVSPYVFAQIWGFIAPGLYAHERKWMIPMAIISGLFFTGGALFGYFLVFPYAFDFFASFSTTGIQFTPKLNEYLSFCLKLLFAFGFVFELPLFIFFLARLGLVSSTTLRKKRKYAILAAFILAAILTPPDPFTQCLMAGPLILLYELGVWVAFFFGKKEKRHLKKQEEAEAKAQAELDAVAEGDGEEKP